jgi:UDP-N-acetylglucosamine 4-epimerase
MKRTRYDDVCEELVNSPRRWLVTGVAGFIGAALLERLLDLGQRVVGVTTSSGRRTSRRPPIPGRLRFRFIGDLRDPASRATWSRRST